MLNLDHNSGTYVYHRVFDRLLEHKLDILPFNPSASHAGGRAAKDLIDRCRESCKQMLGLDNSHIYFTGSATEANGLALKSYKENGFAIVCSETEHASVYNYADELIPVDSSGIPDIKALAGKLNSRTVYAGMFANNETGVLTYSDEGVLTAVINSGCKLHIDASQCYFKGEVLPPDLAQNADTLVLSGHKMHAMRGIGVLVVRSGLESEMLPIYLGGHQEGGLRPGTHNTAAILSMATVVDRILTRDKSEHDRIRARFLGFKGYITDALSGCAQENVQGAALPNTVSLYFPGIVSAELLVDVCSANGLAISTTSACASGLSAESRVIKSMFPDGDRARKSIRLSMSEDTSPEDVSQSCEIIISAVKEIAEAI